MIDIGMIHGRFQPFHNGHLDYLKNAIFFVKHLIVGITNPDPTLTQESDSDSHRHLKSSNPFSYYLRMLMIKHSIQLDKDLKDRFLDITITPMPINKPELFEYYFPSKNNVVQLIRLLDPWDHEKKLLFEKYNFNVVVLEGKRITSGTEIRDSIINDDDTWKAKVPIGTLKVIEKFNKS